MKYRSQQWETAADQERIAREYPNYTVPVPSTDGVCDECPHGAHKSWGCQRGITHENGNGERCNCPMNVRDANLDLEPGPWRW